MVTKMWFLLAFLTSCSLREPERDQHVINCPQISCPQCPSNEDAIQAYKGLYEIKSAQSESAEKENEYLKNQAEKLKDDIEYWKKQYEELNKSARLGCD